MHLRLAMYLRTAITRSGISSGQFAVGHPVEDGWADDGRASLVDWLAGWARREIRFGLYIMSLRTASQFANRHFWKRDQLRPDSCLPLSSRGCTDRGRASIAGRLVSGKISRERRLSLHTSPFANSHFHLRLRLARNV